jgi:hypothetical protein
VSAVCGRRPSIAAKYANRRKPASAIRPATVASSPSSADRRADTTTAIITIVLSTGQTVSSPATAIIIRRGRPGTQRYTAATGTIINARCSVRPRAHPTPRPQPATAEAPAAASSAPHHVPARHSSGVSTRRPSGSSRSSRLLIGVAMTTAAIAA